MGCAQAWHGLWFVDKTTAESAGFPAFFLLFFSLEWVERVEWDK
jgi:hypothetical protein